MHLRLPEITQSKIWKLCSVPSLSYGQILDRFIRQSNLSLVSAVLLKKSMGFGVPLVAQWVINSTSIHEDVGSGSSVTERCGVGGRRSSDPALLWLWCTQAATALI